VAKIDMVAEILRNHCGKAALKKYLQKPIDLTFNGDKIT
jgi:hypothetical protein